MDIGYYKKYEPIDGKWYINKELGRGAYGAVFEIERRDFTNAKSALKIITIPSSVSEVKSFRQENYDLDEQSITSYFYSFVEDFVKEFEVMLQLKGNSNIVSIEDYDVKKHDGEIGWDIFIRMELLSPMNMFFMNNQPTSNDVIKLGIDICKALEVCQKFNIVHRDIKPSNIFVSDTGDFKLGDFGVARTLEKTSSGLSKKGTYTYMAPEVYKGEAYGSNVDIYSLGIVMYKLLNNNMEPFKQGRSYEDEENALIARLKGTPMPKPVNADGRLGEIILKSCAFDPQDRYKSPVQMREELEDVLIADNNASEQSEKMNYMIDFDNNETVGLFNKINTETITETRQLSGLSEKYPEWTLMIAELEEDELLSRINAVDEWVEEFRILCEEEYFKRTGKWISTAVVLSPEEDLQYEEAVDYHDKTWEEVICELTDDELLSRCNSVDEWRDEYLKLCYEEAARRNLDLGEAFGVFNADTSELNYYDIQNIDAILSKLTPDELNKKKKLAEQVLLNENVSLKERQISKYILRYLETYNSYLECEDSTVGVFD